MKKQQMFDETERVVNRELKRLPELRAPATLLHRVMLAVHERERRPWWQRAWPEWPGQMQALSLFVMALIAGAVAAAVTTWLGAADLSVVWNRFTSWSEPWNAALGIASSLGNAAVLLVKAAGKPVLIAGGIVVFASYALSVGAVTTCYRFATQRI